MAIMGSDRPKLSANLWTTIATGDAANRVWTTVTARPTRRILRATRVRDLGAGYATGTALCTD
jgi:hypothetical protein